MSFIVQRHTNKNKMNLHPQIIEKDGVKHVLLPYDEFEAVQDALEDLDDLKELRLAKEEEGSASTVSLNDFKKQLDQ